MYEKFLAQFGLKFEDLIAEEREYLHSWMQALENGQLTVEKIKEYIHGMRATVDIELSKTGLSEKQDTLLKARLRNYILLEAFLESPDKAKKALEQALAAIKNRTK